MPSLHPLLIPGFIATMRVLTPDAVHSPTLWGSFVDGRQGSTIHEHDLSTIPSPNTRCISKAALAHNLSAFAYRHGPSTCSKARAPGTLLLDRVRFVRASPVHRRLADCISAESSSSSYGLVVRLTLLSTPHHCERSYV
jgi:hypothetical protein